MISSYSNHLYKLFSSTNIWDLPYSYDEDDFYYQYKDFLNNFSENQLFWNYLVNKEKEQLYTLFQGFNLIQLTNLLDSEMIFNSVMDDKRFTNIIITQFTYDKYQEYQISGRKSAMQRFSYSQPRFLSFIKKIIESKYSDIFKKLQNQDDFDLIRIVLKSNFPSEVRDTLKIISLLHNESNFQEYVINHIQGIKLVQQLVNDTYYYYGYEIPVILKFAKDKLPFEIIEKVTKRHNDCLSDHADKTGKNQGFKARTSSAASKKSGKSNK